MLTKNEREFINNNRKYWMQNEKYVTNNKKVILIEGQLMMSPNYLLRTAVAAKAIQRATGNKIVAIVDASRETERRTKELCRSFGITDIINIKNEKIPFKIALSALLKSLWAFLRNTPDAILELSYKNIKMGHLVYDDILHDDIYCENKRKHYSIKNIDYFCFKHIYSFYIKAYIFQKILQYNNVMAYVSTHSVYIEYGILPFLAVNGNIPVVYSDDFSFAIINEYENLYLNDRLKNQITKIIKLNDKKELIVRAEDSIKKRMEGYGNVDIKLAYAHNKKSYSREELQKKLGIQNSNPIVFVFAHVFRDAPHVSTQILYQDYYCWLEDTLLCVDKISDVNWILKEHPAGEKVYKEQSAAVQMLNQKSLKNIFVCPMDFNTNSIAKVADAVVTCQGTIGIECSCLGIPTIVCGKAFYTGFGFTIEPRNIKEYKRILNRMKTLKKLSSEQTDRAKMVYAAYCMCYANNQVLLDNQILDCIWGYNCRRNIQEAYKLINEKFENMDFEKSSLYQEVFQYFKNKTIKY